MSKHPLWFSLCFTNLWPTLLTLPVINSLSSALSSEWGSTSWLDTSREIYFTRKECNSKEAGPIFPELPNYFTEILYLASFLFSVVVCNGRNRESSKWLNELDEGPQGRQRKMNHWVMEWNWFRIVTNQEPVLKRDNFRYFWLLSPNSDKNFISPWFLGGSKQRKINAEIKFKLNLN